MDTKILRGLKATTAVVTTFGLVGGLALAVFGIVALFNNINGLISEGYIPTAFIILGSLIVIVSVLGLLGVTANNRSVILVFGVLVGLLLVAQIGIAIGAVSARRQVADAIDQSWSKAWKQTPRVIRDIQETFQCCGLKDTQDRAYPKSSPDACEKSPDFGFKDSCYEAVLAAVRTNQGGIIAIAVSIIAIQVLSFVMALVLYVNIPNAEQREAGLLAEHERLVGEGRVPTYGST